SNLAGGILITSSSSFGLTGGLTGLGKGFASGSNDNLVQGNLIGTDVSGRTALGNRDDGILIEVMATNNTIGGTALAGNVISANADDGVHLTGVAVTGNLIQGNNIGTDLSGTQPLGNAGHGVRGIGSGPNTIGNSPAGPIGRGNRIAYN